MDSFFEKEYENLNDAILKAIVSSKEIQKLLVKLKEKEEIDNINENDIPNFNNELWKSGIGALN